MFQIDSSSVTEQDIFILNIKIFALLLKKLQKTCGIYSHEKWNDFEILENLTDRSKCISGWSRRSWDRYSHGLRKQFPGHWWRWCNELTLQTNWQLHRLVFKYQNQSAFVSPNSLTYFSQTFSRSQIVFLFLSLSSSTYLSNLSVPSHQAIPRPRCKRRNRERERIIELC